MDYKTIIILLALLFLIILVYREVTSLRDLVTKNINNVSLELKETNANVVSTISNNITKCINNIKAITNDNIQQIKKITSLNHQPVTRKIANHFTEIDDSEMGTNINYLSESKIRNMDKNDSIIIDGTEQKKVFEKLDKVSNYYMSEPTVKSKLSETSEMNSRIVCDGNMCYIVKSKEKNNSSPMPDSLNLLLGRKDNTDDSSTLTENIPLYIEEKEEHEEQEEQEDPEELIPVYEKKNNTTSTNTDTISDVGFDNQNAKQKKIEDDYSSQSEKETHDLVNYKIGKNNEIEVNLVNVLTSNKNAKVVNIDFDSMYVNDIMSSKLSSKNKDDDNNNDDMSSDDTVSIEKKVRKIDLTDSIDGIISAKSPFDLNEQIKKLKEFENTKKQQHITTLTINNEKSKMDSRKQKNSEMVSQYSKSLKSNVSKKSNRIIIDTNIDMPIEINTRDKKNKIRQIKLPTDEKTDNPQSVEEHINESIVDKIVEPTNENENENVETKTIEQEPTHTNLQDIQDNVDDDDEVTSDSLLPIEQYTLVNLKEMAKSLSIPLGYKDRGKMRLYRKEELYNNIKMQLESS
jgi:hypothetical protein